MIKINDLSFAYGSSNFCLQVSRLQIEDGETVAFVGPSGAGKTTLLKLISGAIVPNAGTIMVGDLCVNHLDDASRRRFRSSQVGFVFQDFELLDYLNVEENIRLPNLLGEVRKSSEMNSRVVRLATESGIQDKLRRMPSQLSHGERQRVAICRALLLSPRLILADEPTGSLDPNSAKEILNLLIDQASQAAASLLVVTHDHSILNRFDRTVNFEEFVSYRSAQPIDTASRSTEIGQDSSAVVQRNQEPL